MIREVRCSLLDLFCRDLLTLAMNVGWCHVGRIRISVLGLIEVPCIGKSTLISISSKLDISTIYIHK